MILNYIYLSLSMCIGFIVISYAKYTSSAVEYISFTSLLFLFAIISVPQSYLPTQLARMTLTPDLLWREILKSFRYSIFVICVCVLYLMSVNYTVTIPTVLLIVLLYYTQLSIFILRGITDNRSQFNSSRLLRSGQIVLPPISCLVFLQSHYIALTLVVILNFLLGITLKNVISELSRDKTVELDAKKQSSALIQISIVTVGIVMLERWFLSTIEDATVTADLYFLWDNFSRIGFIYTAVSNIILVKLLKNKDYSKLLVQQVLGVFCFISVLNYLAHQLFYQHLGLAVNIYVSIALLFSFTLSLGSSFLYSIFASTFQEISYLFVLVLSLVISMSLITTFLSLYATSQEIFTSYLVIRNFLQLTLAYVVWRKI